MYVDEIEVKEEIVDRNLEVIKYVVSEMEDMEVVEKIVIEMLEMVRDWLIDGSEVKKKLDEVIELMYSDGLVWWGE